LVTPGGAPKRLAKARVEGSNPFSRSSKLRSCYAFFVTRFFSRRPPHLRGNGDAEGHPANPMSHAVHSAMATAPVVAGRNGPHASGPVSARLCEGTLEASSSSMISILELFRRGPARDALAPRYLKAFKSLSVRSLAEARRRAEQVLAKAKRCPRCRTLLNHVFDCLGSTLFIDDNPHVLIGAFKPTEREQFSEQVLAVLIVLRGRNRTFPQHA
jgi:hypothetical protein